MFRPLALPNFSWTDFFLHTYVESYLRRYRRSTPAARFRGAQRIMTLRKQDMIQSAERIARLNRAALQTCLSLEQDRILTGKVKPSTVRGFFRRVSREWDRKVVPMPKEIPFPLPPMEAADAVVQSGNPAYHGGPGSPTAQSVWDDDNQF